MSNIPQNSFPLETLLPLVAAGDKLAFASLYQASSAKLLGIILRIIKERAKAEDILQDVFLKIWQRAGDYQSGRGSALAWMATIARNRALDMVRASQRQMVDSDAVMEELPDEAKDPLAAQMQLEDATRLKHCLEGLEDAPRTMVILAYQDGLSREDLSQRFAIPVATVKTWLRRNLQKLRHCLEATS